jgi:hypothetical protein
LYKYKHVATHASLIHNVTKNQCWVAGILESPCRNRRSCLVGLDPCAVKRFFWSPDNLYAWPGDGSLFIAQVLQRIHYMAAKKGRNTAASQAAACAIVVCSVTAFGRGREIHAGAIIGAGGVVYLWTFPEAPSSDYGLKKLMNKGLWRSKFVEPLPAEKRRSRIMPFRLGYESARKLRGAHLTERTRSRQHIRYNAHWNPY